MPNNPKSLPNHGPSNIMRKDLNLQCNSNKQQKQMSALKPNKINLRNQHNNLKDKKDSRKDRVSKVNKADSNKDNPKDKNNNLPLLYNNFKLQSLLVPSTRTNMLKRIMKSLSALKLQTSEQPEHAKFLKLNMSRRYLKETLFRKLT